MKTVLSKEMLIKDANYCKKQAEAYYYANDYEHGEYYANEAKRLIEIAASM